MNLSLYKLRKNFNKLGQGSLVAVALGGIVLSTLVASATSWYLSMRANLGNTEEKLEAQTIAQSEWERLSHMSLDELEANRNTFKTPYSAGTGSQYQVSVNLGEKGTFNNGTCGNVSGGYANCFKNTTITVYRDGSRLFTTRTLPLMAGDYTRKEIDNLLASMKNELKNDYTNKFNTLNSRMDGKEFVKNRTPNYDLNLRYEKKAGEDKFSLHAYNGNTEIPISVSADSSSLNVKKLYYNASGTYSPVTVNVKDFNVISVGTSVQAGGSINSPILFQNHSEVFAFIDLIKQAGFIRGLNRGGENADRDFDAVFKVTASGDNLTITPTSNAHGYTRPIYFIYVF